MKRLAIILFSFAICVAVAYYFLSQEAPLPIYEATDINTELVDASVRQAGPHRIGEWSLLDQHGNVTTEKDVEGKIYVTDFFFTTCQSICPIMSGQMWRVSEAFKDDERVHFRSFSVIPEEDSVAVLNEYAQAYGINYDRWRLLTGDKKEIYGLARQSFFTLKEAEVGQGDGGKSDFIHTNNFVLVDWEDRIRGYYDGTSVKSIDNLILDLGKLLREGEKNGPWPDN